MKNKLIIAGFVVVLIVVLFFLIPRIRNLIARIKTGMDVQRRENSQHDTPAGTVNTHDVAAGIYDAFYNNDWFGWSEDEDEAIRLILTVPGHLVKEVASNYASISKGKNMYSDFRRLLSASDYALVDAKLKGL